MKSHKIVVDNGIVLYWQATPFTNLLLDNI